jgi:hypothetical protein
MIQRLIDRDAALIALPILPAIYDFAQYEGIGKLDLQSGARIEFPV